MKKLKHEPSYELWSKTLYTLFPTSPSHLLYISLNTSLGPSWQSPTAGVAQRPLSVVCTADKLKVSNQGCLYTVAVN